MEYISKILSSNLERLRVSRNLTRAALAEAVGISQSAYSRYEASGWISDPEVIERLATFYNVRSSRLFHDPDLEEIHPLPPKPLSNKEIKSKLVELIDLIQ